MSGAQPKVRSRAGADLVITYFAKDVARWLDEGRDIATRQLSASVADA